MSSIHLFMSTDIVGAKKVLEVLEQAIKVAETAGPNTQLELKERNKTDIDVMIRYSMKDLVEED